MVADYLSPQCSQPTEKTLSFISLAPRIPPWLTWDTCREKRPIAAAVCCKLVLRRKLVKNPRKLSCFMNLSDIFLSICFKMFATMTIIYVGNQSKVIWLDIERLFDFSYCLITNSCITLFISSTSSLSFFCPDSFHRLFCLWTTFTLSPPPKSLWFHSLQTNTVFSWSRPYNELWRAFKHIKQTHVWIAGSNTFF